MLRKSSDQDAPHLTQLEKYWLAEMIRLQETTGGLLEDAAACRKAARGDDFATRVLLRAYHLAGEYGQLNALRQSVSLLSAAYFLLALVALVFGYSLARLAFSGPPLQINIAVAVASLLGANLVALFVWLFLLLVSGQKASALDRFGLWLSRKFARPVPVLPSEGLLSLLRRQDLLASASGQYIHFWWCLVALASLFTSLWLLSVRQYDFVWESTLINADVFAGLIHALGHPLYWTGLSLPDNELIVQAGGLQETTGQGGPLWANLLLGMLVLYGLLPRLVLALCCHFLWRRRWAGLKISPEEPVWAYLRERLQDTPRKDIIDPEQASARDDRHTATRQGQGTGILLAVLDRIRLPEPLDKFQDQDFFWGVIDKYIQQQELLNHLQNHPGVHLILACDAQRSFGRGIRHFLDELAEVATSLEIWLLSERAEKERREYWLEALADLGLPYSETMPEKLQETGDG